MATDYTQADWRDQLAMFQNDRNLGQTELKRATDKANLYKASGDTDAYNRANTWIGQINTALGGSANPNDNKTSMQTAMNNMNATANNAQPFQFKAPEKFNYSAESDPQYQNALKMALQNAQQATGNTMVGLGARGIGNSSIAVDRANQIQQREVGNVTSNVLPQLIQQAYQRYQDSVNNDYRTQAANYGVTQDQFRNQGALYQALFGSEQAGLDRDRQSKLDNLGAYQTAAAINGYAPVDGPKADWSLLFKGPNSDPSGFAPTMAGQGQAFNQQLATDQFKYGQQQDEIQNTAQYAGMYNGQPTMQKIMQNATLANMSSDNARAAAQEARAAGNQQLGNLFDVWDRMGVAPEGIPGVPTGTPLAGKKSATIEIDPKESTDNYNLILEDLKSPNITKEKAKILVQSNKDYLTASDYKSANEYIDKNF